MRKGEPWRTIKGLAWVSRRMELPPAKKEWAVGSAVYREGQEFSAG